MVVSPVPSEYVFTGQGVHGTPRSLDHVFLRHGLQAKRFDVAQPSIGLPVGSVMVYVPGAHMMHDAAPADDHDPMLQFAHVLL